MLLKFATCCLSKCLWRSTLQEFSMGKQKINSGWHTMWWGGERREGWREGGGFGLCFVPDTVNLKVRALLVCSILQSILLQKILYGNLWDFLSKLSRGFACKKTVAGYCWGKWNICTKPWYQMSSHRSNPLTVVIWPLSTPCISNFHVPFKPVCS